MPSYTSCSARTAQSKNQALRVLYSNLGESFARANLQMQLNVEKMGKTIPYNTYLLARLLDLSQQVVIGDAACYEDFLLLEVNVVRFDA